MRLTCPNCNAQYEVDERVIPHNGRDVQCSACGHTWFQYPKEVALQMRAAEFEDDDEDEDDYSSPPPTDGIGRANTPRIDKTVLDVLREEAERELGERQRNKAGLETQGDLGLTRPTQSKAAPSRIYGEIDAPPEPSVDIETPEDERNTDPVRRRNLLPDIEELTSTLAPGGDARNGGRDGSDATALGRPNGFRNGVSVVALVAMFLLAIYLLAPMIGHYVPASEGILTTYVGLIDSLRATVSAQLRGLLTG